MSLRKKLPQTDQNKPEEMVKQLPLLNLSESKTDEATSSKAFLNPILEYAKETFLQPNGKLLSDEKIKHLLALNKKTGTYLHRKKPNRSGPDRVESDFPIAFTENGIIASITKPAIFGRGNFAEVKIQQNQSTGFWGATKIINAEGLGKDYEESCLRFAKKELEIAQAMDQAQSSTIIQRRDKFGFLKCQLFLKVADGIELNDLIRYDMLPKDPKKLLIIAINFSKEVMRLHKSRFVHRDIKTNNVFVNMHTGKVTLIDFNLGISMNKNGEASGGYYAGTPSIMAPEIFYKNTDIYSTVTDTYSASIVLFAILFSRIQKYKNNDRDWYSNVDYDTDANNQINIRNKKDGRVEYSLNIELWKILKRGCCEEPKKRATLVEISNILKKHLSLLDAPKPLINGPRV